MRNFVSQLRPFAFTLPIGGANLTTYINANETSASFRVFAGVARSLSGSYSAAGLARSNRRGKWMSLSSAMTFSIGVNVGLNPPSLNPNWT